jgi:hypothetical protein
MPLKTNLIGAIIAGGAGPWYSYMTNPQAVAYAQKLSVPLSYNIGMLYENLFDAVGDIIEDKFDSFGICATETEDAANTNLVLDAPNLSFVNKSWLTWEQYHGWSHTTNSGTTDIQDVIVQNGGSGYSGTPTVTISAPGGGGVTATAEAVVVGGVITAINVTNPGSGYPYGGSAVIPTVTISGGGGSGAVAAPRIRMGRIYTGVAPGMAGGKFSQNDSSVAIGSTKFMGTRGACIGNGLSNATGQIAVSRVSLGSAIGSWQGGTLSGTGDIGVYSNANTGHYVFNRTLSTSFDRYFNGVKLSSPSSTSAAPTTYEFVLLSRRINDSWTTQSANSWFWIGKALDETEILRMYYALNAFLAGVGSETIAASKFSSSMEVA